VTYRFLRATGSQRPGSKNNRLLKDQQDQQVLMNKKYW
jgi:hypothetical protein